MGDFTWGHLLTLLGLALSGTVVVGGMIAGWANWRLKAKLDREEYVEKHALVVDRTFCAGQHEKTNGSLEKLTEEFATIGLTVREVLVNQQWLMRTLSTIYEKNHRHANPELPPLEPMPESLASTDAEEA